MNFKDYIGGKDVKWWDGVARTFNRLTSTGGTLSQNKIGSVVDILEVYGSGTAYTSTTLADALGTVGSNKAIFLFQPGTWAISDDATVPANITLMFPHGAVLEIASGKTLTINGPIIAGSYIVFDSTGTVAGAPIVLFKDPTWFSGTVTDSTSPAGILTTINVDTINETTAAAGVTIDGSLIKDGDIKVDTITEKTAAAGVTIDGSLIKDGDIKVDTISEKTVAAGVTIDSVILKDDTVTATSITTDTIAEETPAAGVTIDGCEIKDGVAALSKELSFEAVLSAPQTGISSGVWTKVTFNSEKIDTNSNYDPTTNYRFTPTVAGKYLINFSLFAQCASGSTTSYFAIYKNGAPYREQVCSSVVGSAVVWVGQLSTIADANGSTDYFEAFVYLQGTTIQVNVGPATQASIFSGCRVGT